MTLSDLMKYSVVFGLAPCYGALEIVGFIIIYYYETSRGFSATAELVSFLSLGRRVISGGEDITSWSCHGLNKQCGRRVRPTRYAPARL